MAEEDVFPNAYSRFLEPDQKLGMGKFADTLSQRSLSTSTPCVRRTVSAVKVEEDSGYAESLVDSVICSENAASRQYGTDFTFDIPSSANEPSSQVFDFNFDQFRIDDPSYVSESLPKLSLDLDAASLKTPANHEMDNESCSSSSSHRHIISDRRVPPLHQVDRDFTQDDTDFDCIDYSSIGASGCLAVRLTDVLKHFSPKEQDRVIGRKMLLDKVDIVSELDSRNLNFPCISQIFGYLDPEDLCRVCDVSKQWRSICQRDSVANGRRQKFLRKTKAVKNAYGKENSSSKKSLRKSRGLTSVGISPLQSMQYLGTGLQTPIQPHSTPVTKLTDNWDLYGKAAKSLRNDESLRSCSRCSHPSRVTPSQCRAKCQNPSCAFDYCVNCFSEFHGARPCVPVACKKTKTEIIGTKKSKKNLRRLGR